MPGSTNIGGLNVKVTASAQQFNAIMEDMKRQADSVGSRMRGAGEKLDEFGDVSARTAMRIQHLGTSFAQGGLSGAMESAIHLSTHFGVEMKQAALETSGFIIPLVAAGAAFALFAEASKKAAENLAKMAEKANGLEDALKRVEKAGKGMADAIRLGRLHGSEKLGEAAQDKEDERQRLIANRKQIEREQDVQTGIIQRVQAIPFETRSVIDQAEMENAKKNQEALNKQMDEVNKEILEREKQALELRKRQKEEHGKEMIAEDKRIADEEADAEVENAMKRADEAAEAEKKANEHAASLRHSIRGMSPEGRRENIIEEAKMRRLELIAMAQRGEISGAEGNELLDQLGKGTLGELASTFSGGRENALAGALGAGSAEAFSAVASQGTGMENPQLEAARKQLVQLGLIEENTKVPQHNVVRF